ncbi:hypothetical protein AAFF_G00389850 [Aldrovandia affinis]|uniref:Uncharacterized protein n=1 Tax=Aldrovandia affinis TaxID=143900 RepID=A0AAD7SER2_9TELE|nr:hypothetical protein AAFF_G00389850 [Aldrovandia affinis]
MRGGEVTGCVRPARCPLHPRSAPLRSGVIDVAENVSRQEMKLPAVPVSGHYHRGAGRRRQGLTQDSSSFPPPPPGETGGWKKPGPTWSGTERTPSAGWPGGGRGHI